MGDIEASPQLAIQRVLNLKPCYPQRSSAQDMFRIAVKVTTRSTLRINAPSFVGLYSRIVSGTNKKKASNRRLRHYYLRRSTHRS